MNEAPALTAAEWYSVVSAEATAPGISLRLHADPPRPWFPPLLALTSPGWSILELGSGTGELSAGLALLRRRVTLVDWSDGMLHLSQEVLHLCEQPADLVRADVSDALPFRDRSFDCVWSSGLLEHFAREDQQRILSESARVSRNLVVCLVPNARSLAYRVGKCHQERTGQWRWGREEPQATMLSLFRRVGLADLREETIAVEHAAAFLRMRGGRWLRGAWQQACRRAPRLMAHTLRQGYLLLTAGRVQEDDRASCRA